MAGNTDAQGTHEAGPEKQSSMGRFVPFVLAFTALGIAAVLWLSNASSGTARTCNVSQETLDALDAATVGQMAAMLPTGTGRNYSALSFVDGEGKPHTLEEYAGKPLLVNFWATWCGPCREEMPALDQLSARYKDSPFQVLTIALDLGEEGMAKARQFLDENGLENLPWIGDPSFAAFDQLKSNGVALGLPATLLLDGKGCELAVLQGPAEWTSDSAIALIDKLIALTG